jgi:hypothetical protein
LYTISPDGVIPAVQDDSGGGAGEVPDAAGGLPGSQSGPAHVAAGMIAVRVADVACPGGAAGALVASALPVSSGEMLVFTYPVTVAATRLGNLRLACTSGPRAATIATGSRCQHFQAIDSRPPAEAQATIGACGEARTASLM